VSANASTIRTQTCFRDPSGQFYAYEGCNPDSGCCPMNCTHVWMYEQAVAFLYPELERSMRENAFLVETEPDGRMFFRTRTPRGAEPFRAEAPAAADGQMAEVIQLLRDYQISGDRSFLGRLWPAARRALEYAWRRGGWDADRDGVMEGEQHNTTDIAYFGPNPLMTVLYLAALRSGVTIARELGDEETARTYEDLARRGAEQTEEILWNGEFYQQRLDLAPAGLFGTEAGRGHGGAGDASAQTELQRQVAHSTRDATGAPYNQVGDGCLTDQLFGQWLANLVGLGAVVDPTRIRQALSAVYRHNFKRMTDVPTNFMRAFAVGDERGVLYASFPRSPGGIIPLTAVFRAHEVWTGCEYEVACHMIQEGLIAEGESIVAAIRGRHDGASRNPWNEPECGDHYARAMASYGLLQAYARAHFDLSRGRIELSPQVNRDGFSTFFAVEGAWGTIRVDEWQITIDLGAGTLPLRELVVDGRPIHLQGEQIAVAGSPLVLAIG
jgi:non-lysosomal glucosylceramidase